MTATTMDRTDVRKRRLDRSRALQRFATSDATFRLLTKSAAYGVLILLGGVILSLIVGSIPAFREFGFSFLRDAIVESRHRQVRRAGADVRNGRHIAPRASSRRARGHRHRDLPDGTMPDAAAPADRHRHRTARRHPVDHLRNLGPLLPRALRPDLDPTGPDRGVRADPRAVDAVRGTALRHRRPHGLLRSRDHGPSLHHGGLARRVPDGPARPQGGRLRHRLHDLGSRETCRPALHARRRDRRHHARPRTRARRDDGRHLRDRQRAQDLRLDPRARNDDLGHDRQRIHRGGRRHLHVLADRARPHPLRHHLHRAGHRAPAC